MVHWRKNSGWGREILQTRAGDELSRQKSPESGSIESVIGKGDSCLLEFDHGTGSAAHLEERLSTKRVHPGMRCIMAEEARATRRSKSMSSRSLPCGAYQLASAHDI